MEFYQRMPTAMYYLGMVLQKFLKTHLCIKEISSYFPMSSIIFTGT